MPWAVTTMVPTCSGSDSVSDACSGSIVSPSVPFSEVRSLIVDGAAQVRSLVVDDAAFWPCDRLARPGSIISLPMMSRWHGPSAAVVAVASGFILMAVIDRSTSSCAPVLIGVTRCRLTFGAVVMATCATAASPKAPSSLMTTSSAATVRCRALAERNGRPWMLVPCAGRKLDITFAMPSLHSTTRSSWSSTTSCALLLCHARARW
mmetsp:Transcript_69135/g.193207  ORF Transcript_69135/g.193207 Transcript_69135/m.193207 type:complete len:206 (-) Transcript_69135:320-937(-)